MGPGGLRGLQILLPGADTVRGGFDSHASPPAWRTAGAFASLILILGLAGPGPAAAADEGPSPTSAALRSLVLPGWGQAANGKWLKTVAFAGAYGGLWAWSISLHQDKKDADGRGDLLASARFEDQRNAKYWLAGLTLLLSMVDAYVDAHLRNFDERIDAEVGWIPSSGEPLLGVRIRTTLDSSGTRSR